MPCHAPKLPAPSSHDDYCTKPKVQYLTARYAAGYTCAVCSKAARAKGEPAAEPKEGAEQAKRDSKLAGEMGKENVRAEGEGA
ncbi:hypothetical protein MMC26_000993 [Xylographa opegraphella]|nr:hypothetical protein [Xylographa opegraphella]